MILFLGKNGNGGCFDSKAHVCLSGAICETGYGFCKTEQGF